MGRIRTRWLLTLTALVALVAVLVPTVWIVRSASANSGSSASITLSPATGAAGAYVRLAGSGFGRKVGISITFDTTPVASATTTTSGTFTANFTVPQAATLGNHTVTATPTKGKGSASAAFQVVSGANQWLEFNSLQQGGRSNLFDTSLSPSNVAQLTQDWSTSLGGQVTSFAVFNGVVYTDDGSGVDALNAATGATLWYASTMGGGSIVSSYTSPAVVGGIVYAYGGDNHVYAFNAQTGATLWTFDAHSTLLSSPTVVNGIVYTAARGGYLYALDGATGALIWSYLTNVSDGVDVTPAVANGAVYFISDRGVAYALDANTGALLWNVAVGDLAEGTSAPVVDNGVVYMITGAPYPSTQGEIIALDTATGATKWTAYTSFYGTEGLALANGTLYATVLNGGVYAFDEATGTLKWQDQVGMGESTPAVANGVVYVGAGTSYVYALDSQTGAILATLGNCGTQPYSSPVVAQGVVYAGCVTQVMAFHLPGATP